MTRLVIHLLFLGMLCTGLTACDSGSSNDIDSNAIAGSYRIETLRFTSMDGRYDVNVKDTLSSSRIFVESDSRDFNFEYRLIGNTGRTAISSSYSISGRSITFKAGSDNKEAFQRILLPPKLRLSYDKNNPDRLDGEERNYEVNLKEFDAKKYSATGVEGTLRVVLERLQ